MRNNFCRNWFGCGDFLWELVWEVKVLHGFMWYGLYIRTGFGAAASPWGLGGTGIGNGLGGVTFLEKEL